MSTPPSTRPPSTGPPSADPPSVLTIDDTFRSKNGVQIGTDTTFTINNLDRVVSMKLEITSSGLLKGFVNYNQSHNKNDRAKQGKNKFGFNDKITKAEKKNPALYRVQADADVDFTINPDLLNNSTSLYIELVGSDFKASPSGFRKKEASDQVAVYYDKSGNAFSSSDGTDPLFIGIGVGLGVLLLILIAVAIKLRKKRQK